MRNSFRILIFGCIVITLCLITAEAVIMSQNDFKPHTYSGNLSRRKLSPEEIDQRVEGYKETAVPADVTSSVDENQTVTVFIKPHLSALIVTAIWRGCVVAFPIWRITLLSMFIFFCFENALRLQGHSPARV